MKKLSLGLVACMILLMPLWLVALEGYPIINTNPEAKHLFPGVSNRCFGLGDSHSLMGCFKGAFPKVRMRYLWTYFHDFRYQLVISGALLVLTTYSAIWFISVKDED